jgi:carbon-monoxide dehydrogenase medium subunit
LFSVGTAARILTGVQVPELGSDWDYRYEKFHRTAQALAIVGVAAWPGDRTGM